MPNPVDLHPEASPLARFGFELRRQRIAAGMTQKQLGERSGYSTSAIGMFERAERKPEMIFARRCDQLFGLDGVLTELWSAVDRWKEATPHWFRSGLDAEQEAVTLRTWDPLLIFGVLQTEAYARHVLSQEPGVTDELVEQRLAARMRRKNILSKATPPTIWALIDEGVLRRPIGDPSVMRGQLEHLVEIGGHPKVTIQVLPYAAQSTCGLLSAFVITELPDMRSIVWAESSAGGTVTSNPEIVKSVTDRYDALRAEAHPRHVSLRILKEAIERWT